MHTTANPFSSVLDGPIPETSICLQTRRVLWVMQQYLANIGFLRNGRHLEAIRYYCLRLVLAIEIWRLLIRDKYMVFFSDNQAVVEIINNNTCKRAWSTYVEFSSEFGGSHDSLLLISLNNLALFISYLSARKFASSTISRCVSTVSYVCKLANFPDPTKTFLVQKLLASHWKLQSPLDVRFPITRSVLER